MILGSHNTFTYQTPNKWWMKLGKFIYQTQTANLQEQLKAGVGLIDLRLRFDKYSCPYVCHGLYEAKHKEISIEDFISQLIKDILTHKTQEQIYIRLILETKQPDIIQDIDFVKLCRCFTNKKPDCIKLIGGFRKCDWDQLFELDNPEIVQCVSSVAEDAKWYEKLFPCLYNKRTHKANLEKYQNTDKIVLFDFI